MNRPGPLLRTRSATQHVGERPPRLVPWLAAVQLLVLVPMLAFSFFVTLRMGSQAEAGERQLLVDKANSAAAALAREASRLRGEARLLGATPDSAEPTPSLHAVYRQREADALRVALQPEGLGAVLREQVWPEGWIAALVDGDGRIVARSRDEDRYRGATATPQLRQKIAGADRSVSSTLTLDGQNVMTTIAPVAGTAWWVAVGLPEEGLARRARDPLASLLGMGTCLIVLGLAASVVVARRLNRELRSATSAADAANKATRALAASQAAAAPPGMPAAAEDPRLDPVTGLPLTELFLEQVEHAREVAGNSPGFLWCAIDIELDGIAAAGDRLGRDVADRLLQAFGGRMRRSVRPGDTCGRVGDDAFVIVLTGPRDGLAQAAERVGASLVRGARALGHGLDCKVGFAIGDPAQPASAIFEQAAQARRDARKPAKDATAWFDPSA